MSPESDAESPVEIDTLPEDICIEDPLPTETVPLLPDAEEDDETDADALPTMKTDPPLPGALSPATNDTDPPSAPAPASTETEPPFSPRPSLEPTDKEIPPDDPEAVAPVASKTDPD